VDAISAITARAISLGPVRPVPAVKPVTANGGTRIELLPDRYEPADGAEPSVTYGRTGLGGT
jgi:hypothetical protein